MRLFSDEDLYLEKISAKGDPLERLDSVINWEQFRPVRQRIFRGKRKVASRGGRPSYDYVMMFKLLILQRYNNLSDDAMEYQLLDRVSFRRFLGIDDKSVPDAKTIWLYRNKLTQSGHGNELFKSFELVLVGEGLLAHKGQIVDASFVESPKQHNHRKENKEIKSGKTPEEWSTSKKHQKDIDARWTMKASERHFGYKNHLKSKLITNYQVTLANVHDSQILGVLFSPNEPLFDDSDYAGQKVPKGVKHHSAKRAYRNTPLTDAQKVINRHILKFRS